MKNKKAQKIIYWVSTLWLSLGMVATGVQQLFKMKLEGALSPPGVYGITLLGYPEYILTIIGAWKILGVIAILIPGYPLLKEWAYAGFFFLLTGAAFSHVASGHSAGELFPSFLLLVLTIVSWYFRPENRRIISVDLKT